MTMSDSNFERYTHIQTVPCIIWIIHHNLNIPENKFFKKIRVLNGIEHITNPVLLLTSTGEEFVADIEYVNSNTIRVYMDEAMSGTAIVYKE